ncbi:hypothetical protein MKX01_041808 [Papaver californicum]|nr:hypothetical protein MKX01_041808 [Papaver californicum]
MEKESELWDDSALMNAFDNAMNKYKAMHKKKQHKSISTDFNGEEVNTDNPDNLTDENYEPTRLLRVNDALASEIVKTGADVEEANNVPPVQGNHSSVSEPITHTNGSDKQQTAEGNTSTQVESEYDNLLRQYYELEEQRQKVLQQLQAGYGYNYSYYQPQGEGSGSCAYTQENQHHALYASQQAGATGSSCSPYVCPCLTGLCPLVPMCSSSVPCTSELGTSSAPIGCTGDGTNLSPLQDDPLAQTAIGAAERAIASIKMANAFIGKKEKDKEDISSPSEGSKTDLSVVMNAWFSAGFHTGKYLSEQSIAKKQSD